MNNKRLSPEEEKIIVGGLYTYLESGKVPPVAPAVWQDAEVFIRYLKRDVWSLDNNQRTNARAALSLYRVKYIIEHLSREEIEEILDECAEGENEKTMSELLVKKLHAPIDDLIMIQEKRVVTKDDLEDFDNFDELFKYPAWIEFDDETNELLFEKILNDELTDEQIDYFLGAADDFKNYDQWYKVAKHVLLTTKNSHTFWIAGDILNIIWKAAPDDERTQKWFRDEIFNIFWPRVGSVWPLKNKEMVDFNVDEKSRILGDSISWLESLSDLKERLSELGEDYELPKSGSDEELFELEKGYVSEKIAAEDTSLDEMMDLLFGLSELIYDEKCLQEFESFAHEKFLPAAERFENQADLKNVNSWVERSIAHAKKFVSSLKHEQERIAKYLINDNESGEPQAESKDELKSISDAPKNSGRDMKFQG